MAAFSASPSDYATRTQPSSESVTPDSVSVCPFVDWHRHSFELPYATLNSDEKSAPSPIKLTKSIHALQGGSALAAKNSHH